MTTTDTTTERSAERSTDTATDRWTPAPSVLPRRAGRNLVPRIRPTALLLALLLVVTAAGCGDDTGDEADGQETPSSIQGLVRPEPLEVGEVALPVAASGEPRTMAAAPGELLVAYFGYLSCPDVCPTTMADLESAFAQLEPEDAARLEVVFVTVDPERDDADRLAQYLDHFFERAQGLRPESPEQLAAAEEAFLATSSVTPNDEGGVDVTHSGITYIVDDDGTVLVEWAFGTSPEVMAADLEILLGATTAV